MVPTDELEDWHGPSRRRRLGTGAAIVVVVAVALAVALRPAPSSDEPQTVPDFDLELLSDDGRLSSEELRGGPVVLNLFASWCIPCREEAPLLESAHRRYAEQGLQMIGVNTMDQPDAARAFVRRFDITYPVVRDPEKVIFDGLDLVGLPVTLFVDASGELVASEAGEQLGTQQGTTFLGAISERELEAGIEALLAGEDR